MPSLPSYLATLVREHRDAHALSYAPLGNADHGPMAYLALHALGASEEAVARFAHGYRRKLSPLPLAAAPLTVDDWQCQLGRIESYPAYVAYFDAEISARGWRATLADYLPRLSSAVTGAFHPLIRLAYGIEFELPSEMAAGLAFLACSGPDARLERASAQSRSPLTGASYLKSWQLHRDASLSAGGFGDRYRRILEAVPLRPPAASPDALAELSRASLEVFHASHDFFALHLVTGSAAFRICLPWLGSDADRLLGVTLAAAYLAIGAPDFRPVRGGDATLPLQELHGTTDEHDIKLAHSCRAHARAYDDSSYEWVAARYLAPRLGARSTATPISL